MIPLLSLIKPPYSLMILVIYFHICLGILNGVFTLGFPTKISKNIFRCCNYVISFLYYNVLIEILSKQSLVSRLAVVHFFLEFPDLCSEVTLKLADTHIHTP